MKNVKRHLTESDKIGMFGNYSMKEGEPNFNTKGLAAKRAIELADSYLAKLKIYKYSVDVYNEICQGISKGEKIATVEFF